ncbi:M4 family metallopeptidase [Paenibacillus sp. JX-17]|uniref:Neutral metalloproteinase n=1 Tax=Paenibacillus lacisoli TaxID=3064525 RepID=A0ABT9CFA9_9BACL|nr:M4 family metallopeptidase [Paenibacillus sp. JX-17]MDO7906627.1 M4 family metallopeptidase [Paenibacillus sp. JX-17]
MFIRKQHLGSAVLIAAGIWLAAVGADQAYADPAQAAAAQEKEAVSSLTAAGNSVYGLTSTVQPSLPESVYFTDLQSRPLKDERAVLRFIKEHRDAFGIAQPARDLEIVSVKKDAQGHTHYLFRQLYQGTPVYGTYFQIHLKAGQTIELAASRLRQELSARGLTMKADLSDQQAITALKREIERSSGLKMDWDGMLAFEKAASPSAQLMLYPDKVNGKDRLVYEVKAACMLPSPNQWTGYVDAGTGEVLDLYSQLQQAGDLELDAANQRTYDNAGYSGVTEPLQVYKMPETGEYAMIDMSKPIWQQGETRIKGIYTYEYAGTDSTSQAQTRLVTSGNPQFADLDAVDAHQNAGVVYDFYQKLSHVQGDASHDATAADTSKKKTSDVYSMNSIVHVPDLWQQRPAWDGAAWVNGMVLYGDGSGSVNGGVDCTSCALDIVAHEWTHGIMAVENGLEYRGQSGALNESFADVMGALIEADHDPADRQWWLIGEDSRADHRSLRNLKNPATAGAVASQPMNMQDYILTASDNGAVHLNSGIANHAAYQMIQGFAALLGEQKSRQAAAQMAYEVIQSYLTPVSNFRDAARGYREAAVHYAQQHPELKLSAEQAAAIVDQAWSSAGVQLADRVDPQDPAAVSAQLSAAATLSLPGLMTQPDPEPEQ